MNFFLIAAVILSLNPNGAPGSHSAREVYENCRARVGEIDSVLNHMDIRFTQKMEMVSRGGDKDELVFRIIMRHGTFERQLISGTVANGSRFNAGYDAFDKMFLLSEYFSDSGKIVSSCDFEPSPAGGDYRIKFTFSEPSDTGLAMTTVTASVNRDFIPVKIWEHINGLPLGMEFDDMVDVAHDKALNMYFPGKIVMRIYGKFFFLHGEIGKITIYNERLQKL